MKSQQDKARIGRYINRMVNRKWPIHSLDTDTQFSNFEEAAKTLGVKHKALGSAMYFGHRCNGHHWCCPEMDEHEAQVNLARINNPGDHRKRSRCE